MHLFALHFTYLPRIIKLLNEFRLQYIHHPMYIANNQLPHQLFHEGELEFSSHTGSRSVLQEEEEVLIVSSDNNATTNWILVPFYCPHAQQHHARHFYKISIKMKDDVILFKIIYWLRTSPLNQWC